MSTTDPELGWREPLGDPRIGRREPISNLAPKGDRLIKDAPPLAEIRARLKAEGLSRHIKSLRDIGNGRRMLRLRPGVSTDDRFRVYRICGLRVVEPEQIAIPGRSRLGSMSEPARQGGKAA